MNRSNFYFEQEVTQAEMDQAFDDVQDVAEQQITDHSDPGGDFATWGVVVGLVVAEQGTPDLTVQISDGVAYDENGKRIPHSGGPTSLDLTSLVPGSDSRYVRVYVEHDTVESDPRVDGAAVPLNYRIADSFAFSLDAGAIAASPVKPTITAGKVLLATILLYTGQTQILDADISLALGNTYGPGIDEIDRQEGGVVAHGRMLTRAIGFEYEVNGPPKICMGRNDLNMEQGDLWLDYLQAGATGGGGRIFCEDGRIYKAREIRAGGPPDGNIGYHYYDFGEVGSDEFGSQIVLEKWASIPPDVMRCHTITYPKDPANSPVDWELQPLTDTGGNLWPFNLFSPSTFDYSGHRWYGNLLIPALNSNWIAPLHIPLVGLPDGARLIRVEVDFDFPDGVGTGDLLGVYCLLHRQKWGKTAYTAGKNDVIYIGPATAERNGWGGTGDPPAEPDGRVRVVGSVASGGQVIDNENWCYFALLFLGGYSPGGTDLDVHVGAAHALYEIREASNVY